MARLITVKSAECTGCLDCVAACPVKGALDLTLPRRRVVPAWAVAAGIVVLFAGLVGVARWTGNWDGRVKPELYRELVQRAAEFGHPR